MAKLTEILNLEKDRNENLNIIHLHKEGGFYRAYEWSAFLVVCFCYTDEVRNSTQERKPLSVSRKRVKGGDETFTFIGFPLKSIDKFIPAHDSFNPVDNSIIDISVILPDISCDDLAEMFNGWKESIQITEEKQKHINNEEVSLVSHRSITSIMSQVLSYPLESKTPIENMMFISTLKRQLSEII